MAMTTEEQLIYLKDKVMDWKTELRQTYGGCDESMVPNKIAREMEVAFIKMEDESDD